MIRFFDHLGRTMIVDNIEGGPFKIINVNDSTIRLDYTEATEIYDSTFSVKTKNRISLKQALANTVGAGKQVIVIGVLGANCN